jgi:hypothetical protein
MIGAPRGIALANAAQRDRLFPSVSLLLHFDNNLTDSSTTGASFSTSGSAALSSTQSRFGGFSLSTTGPSNGTSYTTSSNTSAMSYSGDFTIECWIYPTANNGNIFDTRKTIGGNYRQQTGIDASGKLQYIPYLNSAAVTVVTSNLGVTLNTWNHVAWCRSAGTTRMFINGTLDSVTYTDAFSYTAEGITIGATGYTIGYGNFSGYIDEFRVTKAARYTASFTPPALPFPNF